MPSRRSKEDLARHSARGSKLPEGNRISRDAVDTSTRHQVFLERLGVDTTAKVVAKANKLETVVTGALQGELKTNSDLESVLAEIQDAGLQTLADATWELSATLEQLGEYESQYNGRELGGYTRGVRIRTLKAAEAYKLALENPIPATGDLLADFIENWSTAEIESVGKLVSRGFMNGWTNQDIVRAIRGTRAANYEDGVMAVVRKDAEAVVRTSVQQVANTARMETWARNSDVVIGYKIVAVLDGVTTIVCRGLDQRCRDGLVFKVNNGPQPPLHVNCRSTTVPVLAEKYDWLKEGAMRSSETGPVDASEGYYSWLKRQPSEFQDEALGATRAKLFRDGGLSAERFAELSLNKRFEPMTLEQMRRLEPLAFKRAAL